jgi:hypothetical protein
MSREEYLSIDQGRAIRCNNQSNWRHRKRIQRIIHLKHESITRQSPIWKHIHHQQCVLDGARGQKACNLFHPCTDRTQRLVVIFNHVADPIQDIGVLWVPLRQQNFEPSTWRNRIQSRYRERKLRSLPDHNASIFCLDDRYLGQLVGTQQR